MKTVFIYALKDPDTGQIRYIGKADNPEKRLRKHLCDVTDNYRTRWIKNLSLGNLKPVLALLDEVPEVEWSQWECAYIEYFRERGCNLVNGTPGGDGSPHKCSLETRATMSAAHRGERNPFFGKTHSTATREKISATHKGRTKSPVTRAKMSKAQMGNEKNLGKSRPPHAIFRYQITRSFNKLLKICQPLE